MAPDRARGSSCEGSTPWISLRLTAFDPEGDSDRVDFLTRKVVIPATKSPVNRVVLDGAKGNTWEERLAELLEADQRVAAFVKNDHLDFKIPHLFD